MDDDDYRALIEVLSEELRMSGAADIADERHYVKQNEETGETELIEPSKRIIEMLTAFDRHLAIQDVAMYALALEKLRINIEGPSPESAVVVLANDETMREVDLSKAPDLQDIRKDLKSLLETLGPSDLRPDSKGPR